MLRDVFITGLGLVTPLGEDAQRTWSALIAGHAVDHHARAAGSPSSADRIYAIAGRAAAEAIAQAGWNEKPAPSGRTALIVGTSKGAIETHLIAPPGYELRRDRRDNAGLGLASVAQSIQATFPLLDGPAMTLSAACASGLHALIRGAMMIRAGEVDRALILAAEASTHPMFLASFQRLGVLAKSRCRPFDIHRDGFLMTEAGAAVCLESVGRVDSLLPQIDRFALAGDATHITGSDPAGSTLRQVLKTILRGAPIDLVHAHGTGTVANDPIELASIEAECAGGEPVQVYSHKGALGHSLGASGLVSVVLNALMHQQSTVPANVRTTSPLPAYRVMISQEITQAPIRHSIALATGFGGATAGISLISG